VIENQFYRITLASRGAITSWVDKIRSNRQFVRLVNGRAINDLGDGTGTLQVENAGPVSVTLLATSSSPIAHTSRITFIRNSERVEIQNDINQNFNSTYTWGFGFELNNPDTWHEEVGAVIRAKLTTQGGHYSPRVNNSRYDWLTLNHFVDIGDGPVGVTLSNADCYFMRLGNSTVSNLDVLTPQISVLVGGSIVGAGGAGLPNQGGDTHFLQRFALSTHDTYDQTNAMKFALEHQNPLVVGNVIGGVSYPESSFSLLSIDNPNILVWALKPADDSPNNGL
jgi:alpha-mannosidase